MPDPDLIPGFFGKLPSTGDFVSRGLPTAFTAVWDRWLARHLAARLQADAQPLCFHRAGPPPVSGVVLPSRDRAGRRFPLTLAAPGRADPEALIALAELGTQAIAQGLPPDDLAARLAAQPLRPHPNPTGDSAALLLWTAGATPHAADPDAPGPSLDLLLVPAAGVHP